MELAAACPGHHLFHPPPHFDPKHVRPNLQTPGAPAGHCLIEAGDWRTLRYHESWLIVWWFDGLIANIKRWGCCRKQESITDCLIVGWTCYVSWTHVWTQNLQSTIGNGFQNWQKSVFFPYFEPFHPLDLDLFWAWDLYVHQEYNFIDVVPPLDGSVTFRAQQTERWFRGPFLTTKMMRWFDMVKQIWKNIIDYKASIVGFDSWPWLNKVLSSFAVAGFFL